MVGRPESGAWTEGIQGAWEGDGLAPIPDAYPGVWRKFRLLPEEPPASPVAAGFVTDVSGVAEDTLAAVGVDAPELNGALNLVRMEAVAFVSYADGLEQLPAARDRQAVRDARVDTIVVTSSAYPGFVVSFLFDRFATRAGLEETEVGGRVVLHRALDDDLHMMLRNYGSFFFIALSPTEDGAAALMRSVIDSQQSR